MKIVHSTNILKYKLVLTTLLLVLLAVSCKTPEPASPYQYEKNPTFTWGFAEFYGNYFSNYQIENNDLVISVIDNGKGLNEKTESKHKSLATTITKERIENILKLLKVKIEMDIVEAFPESENKGLKVEFRIPQIK